MKAIKRFTPSRDLSVREDTIMRKIATEINKLQLELQQNECDSGGDGCLVDGGVLL